MSEPLKSGLLKLHKPSKSLVLTQNEGVPLQALIPHVKTVGDMQIVPHKREETRVLRNMGLAAPSPIMWHYEWAGLDEPFISQKKTAALLSMNTRAYVLNTMGTGKTRASLYAADFLLQEKDISKVLVVAPLSTLVPTWKAELDYTFPHRKSVVLHGARSTRLKLLQQDVDFYIINHDGIKTLFDALRGVGFDCAIIDELAVYRNQGTARWKYLRDVIKRVKFVWGLTGAPTPNAPTDAFAQAKLLRPDTVTTFGSFRDKTMYQTSLHKWLPKKDANDHVHALLQPSVRYKLEDCIDIPPTTYITREVGMSANQTKVYKAMMTHYAAQYEAKQIVAANEAVKLQKLLQVAGGYVYDEHKNVIALNPSKRMAELRDLIEETESKVIVFVPYIHTIKAVSSYLDEHGIPNDVVYSAVSKNARDGIFHDFQHNPEGRKVIVAHPKTMSHGLTLTAATLIVWYGPIDSLDTYIQANARIARPGQSNHTTIAHLQGSKVEEKVYQRLRRKESVQGSLLAMFAGVNDGVY